MHGERDEMARFFTARIELERAARIAGHAIPPRDVATASREIEQCVALLFAGVDGRAQVLRFAALRLHRDGRRDAGLCRDQVVLLQTRACRT